MPPPTNSFYCVRQTRRFFLWLMRAPLRHGNVAGSFPKSVGKTRHVEMERLRSEGRGASGPHGSEDLRAENMSDT